MTAASAATRRSASAPEQPFDPSHRSAAFIGRLGLLGQFLGGCLGAATPWVLRGAQVVGFKLDVALPRIGAGSVLIFLAVLLFGGAAAIILHSHNRWVAWYHGATYRRCRDREPGSTPLIPSHSPRP